MNKILCREIFCEKLIKKHKILALFCFNNVNLYANRIKIISNLIVKDLIKNCLTKKKDK